MPKKLKLERIDPATSSQDFFTKYVSKRQPVIISGLLDDSTFKGDKWTDLSYLSGKAGDVEVLVEPIHPTANQYGTDVERVPMTFRDFVHKLRYDDGPHPYLTTQYSEEDPDAETVFPPPTNALLDEFPRVPRLMGHLFLQQVNLWLGKSNDGSSSGLHHDFHDNLYCLLQGRKRFVLFPPAEVKHLYPYGSLDIVHPNGLISYSDIPVRSDGLSKRAACQARVHALERKIDALKTKGKGGKGKSKATQSKEMIALMNAHDEALDELAVFALEDQYGGNEVDDFDALMGGLDGEDDAAGPSRLAATSDEGSDDDDVDEESGEGAAKQWPEWNGIGHSDDSENQNEGEGEGTSEDDRESDGEGDGASDGDSDRQPSEPSSFSRIPTAYLHQYLEISTTASLPTQFSASAFAALQNTTAPYVVDLSAGEMLYLPASWWHEVTSTSAPPSAAHGEKSRSDIHMAFNYWFYPPDALNNFEAPYEDELVWSYIRNKDKPSSTVAGEKVKMGKRERESGNGGGSKKARR